jgi:hypothetical protein
MFLRIIPLLLTGWLAMPLAAEEVRQQFEGLTLNANLELAQAKTLEDGVVGA